MVYLKLRVAHPKPVGRLVLAGLLCCIYATVQAGQAKNVPLMVATSLMAGLDQVRGIQSVGPEEYLATHPAGTVGGSGTPGAPGATGATGSNGEVINFLYGYTNGVELVSVDPDAIVPFTNNLVIGIQDLQSGSFAITDPGFYFVSYSGSKSSGGQISGQSFQLYRQTINDPEAIVGTATYNGSWAGILALYPGDTLSLKNVSGLSISDVYVTLNIIQLTSGLLPV